ERLETFHHELGGTTAQHDLLTEQIGLGFLRERRRENAAARTADAMCVGEGVRLRILAAVLEHGQQARDTTTLLILTTHEIAGTLGRDQYDVEILARLDLTEMNVEAMREQDRRAFRNAADDLLIEVLLREVGRQERDQRRTLHGFRGLRNL